ncbi:hypothetical protein ATANTOWER_013689 [Ataeniobius toweri]|uniref:Uncharacterized protein n=1 Tax=Ataeniobius toweri TaxID=208326 RepID=A0ABU7CBQ9_9TELE|nr:hypothetical protein [Ataeniobius toweri]
MGKWKEHHTTANLLRRDCPSKLTGWARRGEGHLGCFQRSILAAFREAAKMPFLALEELQKSTAQLLKKLNNIAVYNINTNHLFFSSAVFVVSSEHSVGIALHTLDYLYVALKSSSEQWPGSRSTNGDVFESNPVFCPSVKKMAACQS